MKRRVIHIWTRSAGSEPTSKVRNDYDTLWHFKLAQRIHAASDEYVQECWAIDSKLSKEIAWEEDGVRVRVFPCITPRYVNNSYSGDLLEALKTESRKQGVILHLHGLFTYTTLLAPLTVKKAPMIVQHHGSADSLLWQSRNSPSTIIKLGAFTLYALTGQWFLERLSIPRFDRIFVCDSEAEHFVIRLAGTKRVQRLSMGIDFSRFVQVNKGAARKTLALAPDKRYILFVGNLAKIKGVDYLLKGLSVILNEYPNAFLLIVGTGYHRERLVTLTRQLNLDAHVEFVPSDKNLPRIRNDVMPLYYSAADVVVLPSLGEGLPIVALEALACGAPLVATSVGGIPDIVATFNAGLLVEPRSPEALAGAVLDVLSGGKPFIIDRENGERAYDWRVIVAKNLAAYDALFREYYTR